MICTYFATAAASATIGYHLVHTRPNGRYLFYDLLDTFNVGYRAGTLGTVVQGQLDCLIDVVRFLATATGMARLATGEFLLVGRYLLLLFPTKRTRLAGHLPLGIIQLITQLSVLVTQLSILILKLTKPLVETFDFCP
jgi:hypothetical protein